MSFFSAIDRPGGGSERLPSWRVSPLNASVAKELEQKWQDLAINAAEKNIFSFPWFVIPSIDLLAPKDPQILTIYDEDLLIGLFLFRGDSGYAALPISFDRTALHPEQFSGLPLVRAGFEDKFARGLCDWIDAAPRTGQFLLMDMMASDRPVTQALMKICEGQGRSLTEVERFDRAAILPKDHLEADADALIRSSRRKSLRRKARNLAKQGAVKFERLTKKEALQDWLEEFLAQENSGWKKEAGSSVLSNPNEIAFYQEMIPSAFDQNALNFFRLTLDGRAIAYTLDLLGGPQAYCMKCAFDHDYRQFSPGVLMEYETLKFYLNSGDFHLVDSCTDPQNSMLNDIWPDKVAMATLAISRRSAGYRMVFRAIHFVKGLAKRLRQSFAAPARKEKKSNG